MIRKTSAVRLALTLGISMALTACGRTADIDDPGQVEILAAPNKAVLCEADTSKEIGQQADSVVLPARGHHRLIIPANAVPQGQKMRFRIADMKQTYVGVRVTGPSPTYNPPLRLRLSYSGCVAPDTANLQIYKWGVPPGGGPAQWTPVNGSALERDTETVSAPLGTLSEYALGAP